MSDWMFDSPVFVKSGTSLIEEIACLEDCPRISVRSAQEPPWHYLRNSASGVPASV